MRLFQGSNYCILTSVVYCLTQYMAVLPDSCSCSSWYSKTQCCISKWCQIAIGIMWEWRRIASDICFKLQSFSKARVLYFELSGAIFMHHNYLLALYELCTKWCIIFGHSSFPSLTLWAIHCLFRPIVFSFFNCGGRGCLHIVCDLQTDCNPWHNLDSRWKLLPCRRWWMEQYIIIQTPSIFCQLAPFIGCQRDGYVQQTTR